ncbi:MAG: YkvA family protein [Sedimentibacter sp.]|uniref:YkvA family protein n=1 Tax=Sedimentibacter sp. TaxID=1960295 RepID=UPI002981F216|nr:YkvA family protein [Sedimentibacter sp.]MDW5299524.1 YkvA family protein [Sedimentibacter sp.]
MDINFDDISKMFGKKAKEYAGDKEKTSKLLRDAAKKANDLEKKKGPLEEIWYNIQLLFGMVKDWISGEYKAIPVGSIVVIIIGLLYFVSPVDIIPDFIPGGLVDDALVLGLVIKQVKSDIDKYKVWKESY